MLKLQEGRSPFAAAIHRVPFKPNIIPTWNTINPSWAPQNMEKVDTLCTQSDRRSLKLFVLRQIVVAASPKLERYSLWVLSSMFNSSFAEISSGHIYWLPGWMTLRMFIFSLCHQTPRGAENCSPQFEYQMRIWQIALKRFTSGHASNTRNHYKLRQFQTRAI